MQALGEDTLASVSTEGEEICRISSENIQITIPGEDDERC